MKRADETHVLSVLTHIYMLKKSDSVGPPGAVPAGLQGPSGGPCGWAYLPHGSRCGCRTTASSSRYTGRTTRQRPFLRPKYRNTSFRNIRYRYFGIDEMPNKSCVAVRCCSLLGRRCCYMPRGGHSKRGRTNTEIPHSGIGIIPIPNPLFYEFRHP